MTLDESLSLSGPIKCRVWAWWSLRVPSNFDRFLNYVKVKFWMAWLTVLEDSPDHLASTTLSQGNIAFLTIVVTWALLEWVTYSSFFQFFPPWLSWLGLFGFCLYVIWLHVPIDKKYRYNSKEHLTPHCFEEKKSERETWSVCQFLFPCGSLAHPLLPDLCPRGAA